MGARHSGGLADAVRVARTGPGGVAVAVSVAISVAISVQAGAKLPPWRSGFDTALREPAAKARAVDTANSQQPTANSQPSRKGSRYRQKFSASREFQVPCEARF